MSYITNHLSKKIRRHDGLVYPYSTLKIKKKDIIEQCLEPQAYWDDWIEYRDGHRGYSDKSKINGICGCYNFLRRRYNNKIKRQKIIRKARQESNRNI